MLLIFLINPKLHAQDDILEKLNEIAIVDQKVMVPMRDGVRLATDIYRPKNVDKAPIIFSRTPYNFNSDTGSYDDRFVLRYTDTTLSTNNDDLYAPLNILAFNNSLKIESETLQINKVVVYDIQGRLIQTFSNINSLSFTKKEVNLSSGSYLVNVILENGFVSTKKVIFN